MRDRLRIGVGIRMAVGSIGAVVLLACSLGAAAQEPRQSIEPVPASTQPLIQVPNPDLPHWQSVDYSNASAPESGPDAARARRFDEDDDIAWVSKEPSTPGHDASTRINHWAKDVPALPTDRSDAVVLATVTGATARLTPSRTRVFTEFAVSVERVLKTRRDDVVPGGTLTIVRLGGDVRYSPQSMIRYAIDGQAMLDVGSRYFLFLESIHDGADYLVITGYVERGDRVFALDGGGRTEESGYRFSKYEDTPTVLFLRDLNAAIR